MNYTLFLLLLSSLFVTALLVSKQVRHKWLKRTLKRELFPSRWLKIVKKNMPHYKKLPESMQRELEAKIMLFVEEKEFVCVGNMAMTDEIKVTIAAYAALMALGIDEDYEWVKTILVYELAFIIDKVQNQGGIASAQELILEGMSAGNTVVIAWNEARREALHPHFGHNVIVHEFAHELDYANGLLNGTPKLENSSAYKHWGIVMNRDFKALYAQVRKNRYLGRFELLGSYAATHESEFFAVLSELFFERPVALKRHFPELYNTLKSFYKIDAALLFEM